MANVPTVACTNCGKNFTTDDLRGTACKYCGTLLAHHARAQQQVAVINEMMADRNGNGIPDAYEGLVANAQANAMNQVFNPYAQQPPMGGMGMGMPPNAMGPMPMGPMNPYGNPYAGVQVAQTINRTARTMAIVISVSVVFVLFLTFGMMAFFLAR